MDKVVPFHKRLQINKWKRNNVKSLNKKYIMGSSERIFLQDLKKQGEKSVSIILIINKNN